MTRKTIPSLAALALLISAAVLYAGPINPPTGPVASTAKTLGEVEPRIAVNSTNTPGDTGSLFKITQSGSYYLTGNIVEPAGRQFVIEILTGGVTLDLGGFLISGGGTAQHAVRVAGGVQTVQIKNGFIAGCLSHGITCQGNLCEVIAVNVGTCGGNGIDMNALARVRDCTIRGNGSHGIRVGNNSTVSGCISSANAVNGIEALSGTSISNCVSEGNAVGFRLSSNCAVTNCRSGNPTAASSIGFQSSISDSEISLTDCSASGGGRGFWFQGGRIKLTRCSATGMTGSQTAIEIGPNSLLTDCRASDNSGHGFLLFSRCTLTNCTAAQNLGDGYFGSSDSSFINCTAVGNNANGFNLGDGVTVQGCTANNNLARGISMANGGSVINCTTRNNQNDGIAVNFSCFVRGNSCNGDGTGIGFEAAVRATGQANRIEGNNITFADRGILVSSGGNAIFGNSVKGCTVNFDIAGGNDTGPIGSAATATSPWANIQY